MCVNSTCACSLAGSPAAILLLLAVATAEVLELGGRVAVVEGPADPAGGMLRAAAKMSALEAHRSGHAACLGATPRDHVRRPTHR